MVRVHRDDIMIAMLETEVEAFLGEVDALVSELMAMQPGLSCAVSET